MNRLFRSEAVSEGHPDKVADQISEYNKKYYEKNKAKILASRKASKTKPYNYLTEAHRRASREYYRRKKERMTIEEHDSILAKRREAYKRK